MRKYWPLVAIAVLLAAIVGLSQYAESAKRRHKESTRGTKAAAVAKDDNDKADKNTEDAYMPPIWAKYVTFPEGVGAWAIILTLLAIAWQSVETRAAAEAANHQAAIQREALRPRLSISRFTNDIFDEARTGDWVFVKMKISNSGGMPAYGVIIDTWIEFIPGVPPYKFSSNAKYARSSPINVHTGNPSGFVIPLHRRLTDEERYQIAKAQGTICLRVRMLYRAFGDDVHTDEAYMVRPKEMDGMPEYSSAT